MFGAACIHFSNGFLVNLLSKCGFTLEEICVHNKQVENRLLDLVVNRNWIQATFTVNSAAPQGSNEQHDLHACEGKDDKLAADTSKKKAAVRKLICLRIFAICLAHRATLMRYKSLESKQMVTTSK